MEIVIREWLDVNHKPIIFDISSIDKDLVFSSLNNDRINHLYEWKKCLKNNLFYIYNCDLQYVDSEFKDPYAEFLTELEQLIKYENYKIYELKYNSETEKFYYEGE